MSLVFMAAIAATSPAIAADRLTDSEVKALVARIEQGRDLFDDALDDDLKDRIVRGDSGEVSVDHFLDDFQRNIDQLEERLTPEYAASAEARTLLRQASVIDRFFRQHPAGTRGESEWTRLTTDLKSLAAAYGAGFPLGDDAAVRRMGDREVAAGADELAQAADRVKRSLDADLKKDIAVDPAVRTGIVREADQLQREAKTLRDRVRDGRPSSAEADQVLSRAEKLRAFIDSHAVPTAAASWAAVDAHLQVLGSAYGIRK
jgi:hypothetical protein